MYGLETMVLTEKQIEVQVSENNWVRKIEWVKERWSEMTGGTEGGG